MPSRRFKKWSIRLAGLVVLLAILTAILWLTVLPRFIEKQITSALYDAGFQNASIKLRKITTSRATLENLVLDPKYGFRIGEIQVLYSLVSLMHARVKGIALIGLEAELGMHDKVLDLGPFANLQLSDSLEQQSKGKPKLPFDYIELKSSKLRVDWEGREYDIPVNANVHKVEGDSVIIGLQASLEGAALSLAATIDFNTYDGAADFEIENLALDLLKDLSEPYMQGQELKCDGYLNFKGHVISRDGKWQGGMAITENQLRLEAAFKAPELEVTLSALKANLAFSHPGITRLDASASLNDTPLSFLADVDPRTLDGEGSFEINDVDAQLLTKFVAPYLPDQPLDFRGRITIGGKAVNRKGRITSELTVDGRQLSLHTVSSGRSLLLSQPVLNAEVQLDHSNGEVKNIRGDLELQNIHVADSSLGLAIEEVRCSVPFTLDEKAIEQGTFAVRNLHSDLLEIPLISGSFSVVNERARISLSGNILPEALLEATGWVDLSKEGLFGEISARVPRFTLESAAVLTEKLPALEGSDLGGTVAVDAHIELRKGEIMPRFQIDVEDAFWKRPEADASIDGIAGSLTVGGFAPVVTDDDQRIVWDNMTFGSFKATNGSMVFRLVDNGDDVPAVKGTVECDWIGGKLWSDSILVQPKKSSVSFHFHAEKLSLQGILDFLEYDGVKGTGWIYGNLPVSVNWGERTHVSFGDGVMEARPQKGQLQLSKETAMMILGMTHDINPKTASKQEMAELLMLRALQDMEYSKLQVTFHDDMEQEWVTSVQIQGHGPVGDKENRVPIGGLNIEVNNLDDLLNSVILPGIQSRNR